MKSLWNDDEAATYTGALGPRVYTSRLLGRDKSLVLHGGGNTSVKLTEKNLFGEALEHLEATLSCLVVVKMCLVWHNTT